VLVIVLEISHISRLAFNELSVPTFFIIPVLPLVNLLAFRIFKVSFSVAQVIDELSLVIVAVCPKILALPVGSIFSVLAYICLSVKISLSSITLLL